MAKTTPSRGSDHFRAAAASDRDHSEPSSTERAKATNAARFGRSYTASRAKRKSPPEPTAAQINPATSSTSARPPVTNRDLPDMSCQMSSRHQLPSGRSRTGFNTPAEVQEGKSSAFRKFPVKAYALELAAREARGVEKIDPTTAYQDGPDETMEHEFQEDEVVQQAAGGQRRVIEDEQEKGMEDDSEYDSDA